MEVLSFEEVRILGSLIEKENTTPEYYPLTINSLINACNQKSSRNPVVTFDESVVENTIQILRDKKLVSKITGPEIRVPKYQQIFTQHYQLTIQQTAVLCVLFLRGAQTIGEIKSRCYRIYEFKDLAETEETLETLMNIEDGPFVIKLPKDSGRENRYTHLFCGEPDLIPAVAKSVNFEEKITELESELNSLRADYESLREEFNSFKNQF